MPETLVLATRNHGKARELVRPLAVFGLRVICLGDPGLPDIPDVEETGRDFAENARLKAETVSALTGLASLADDSGLAVDALAGAPGVHSARYWQPGDTLDSEAQPALSRDGRNIRKLLLALRTVPTPLRTARFCCAMCLVRPGAAPVQTEGCWEGRILEVPRGQGGFGYDSVFLDQELNLSAAEMPAEVKMRRSHRAMALNRLLRALACEADIPFPDQKNSH
jgi:XTP/dITP diphosphohydrolase